MSHSVEELTKLLEKASDAYYNEGITIMSDKEYDALFDELRALEEANGITDGFTSRVGAKASGKFAKVKHEYEAKSLDKTKSIEELIAIQSKGPRGDLSLLCLSWKMDGSTVQLTYNHGKLVTAATRGDGQVGQNITRNAGFIKGIPLEIPYLGKLTVRGEVTMDYQEFDRINAVCGGVYANPRNLANATITAEDADILMGRRVNFRPFKLVYTDAISENIFGRFSKSLDYLKHWGFEPVEHEVVMARNLKEAIERWSKKERIDALPFQVDGLVVAGEEVEAVKNLPGTGHHPNRLQGMAFKWQDETKTTTLNAIEWQVGRTGVLTPVAIFDPVELEGTVVTKASLHNLSYILDKDLRIGDRITIYKANMIIPQVDENLSTSEERKNFSYRPYRYAAEKPKDMKCPCCQGELVIKRSGPVQTINCENENCFSRQVARMEHMFSKDGLNVEGLSESTIEIMAGEGIIKSPADLYHLTAEDFTDRFGNWIYGFGERSVAKLLDSIEKSRKTDAAHFLYACGIPGFGKGQIKLIQNYVTQKSECMDEAALYECKNLLDYLLVGNIKFEEIPGIGPVISANLQKFLSEYMERGNQYGLLHDELIFADDLVPSKEKGEENEISGKTFVITGSLNHFENRDAAFAWIEANGGKTSGSVSAKTSYLVNNDVTSTSGKNKKAKELGIPIISEEDLLKMGMTKDQEEEKERE